MAQNQPSTRSDVIQALLAEYDACYKTRDHYDSVAWTIGSIFIASSFFLLGVSFQIPKINFVTVVSISVVSLLLLGIWYAYVLHVEPYIKESNNRARDIEIWVNQYCGGNWLQLQTMYLSRHKPGRGRAITYSLFVLILATALARIIIFLVYGQ